MAEEATAGQDFSDVFTFSSETDSAAAGASPASGSSAPAADAGKPAAAESAPNADAPKDGAKPAETPAPATAAPAGDKPATPPAAAAPAQPPAAPVTPPASAPAQQPQQAQQPPAAAQPSVQRLTPEQEVAAVKDQERRLVADMTKNYALTPEELKLSKEEAEAFATDPDKAIPAFMARVLPGYIARCGLSLFYATQHSLGAVLPDMMGSMLQQSTAQREAVDSLFSEFKDLDRNNQDQLNIMVSFAKLYKEQHPEAKPQEIRQFVGRSTMAYFGITPKAAAPAAPPVAPAPPLPPYRPPATSAPGAPMSGQPTVETFFENFPSS